MTHSEWKSLEDYSRFKIRFPPSERDWERIIEIFGFYSDITDFGHYFERFPNWNLLRRSQIDPELCKRSLSL
jgi:hypothetical protein